LFQKDPQLTAAHASSIAAHIINTTAIGTNAPSSLTITAFRLVALYKQGRRRGSCWSAVKESANGNKRNERDTHGQGLWVGYWKANFSVQRSIYTVSRLRDSFWYSGRTTTRRHHFFDVNHFCSSLISRTEYSTKQVPARTRPVVP